MAVGERDHHAPARDRVDREGVSEATCSADDHALATGDRLLPAAFDAAGRGASGEFLLPVEPPA